MADILKKEILGKSFALWIHYPIVLGILFGLLHFMNEITITPKLFLISLVILIISDLAIENILGVKS